LTGLLSVSAESSAAQSRSSFQRWLNHGTGQIGLGFTTGDVTSVLDRLEKAGYIRRRPDPGDRRRQLVETTEATATRDEEVFGDLIRGTRNLLADYPDHELLVIRRSLTRRPSDAFPGPCSGLSFAGSLSGTRSAVGPTVAAAAEPGPGR
jgi:DNA-binding PadR family transcriptional regulator